MLSRPPPAARRPPTCGFFKSRLWLWSHTSPLHRCFRFSGELASLFGFPFVVELLSPDHGNLGLHLSALEVKPQRDDGETFFNDLLLQSLDLPPMEEELATALRIVILAIAVAVRRDVRTHQISLAVLEVDVAVLQIDPPLAQRLHLGAGERHPRFDLLQHEV